MATIRELASRLNSLRQALEEDRTLSGVNEVVLGLTQLYLDLMELAKVEAKVEAKVPAMQLGAAPDLPLYDEPPARPRIGDLPGTRVPKVEGKG